MAAKKKSSFKLGKRAAKLVRQDLLHSVAIASVVLNILFLVGWAVIINGGSDRELYDTARERLCVENYDENIARVINEAEDDAAATTAVTEFTIECVGDDFEPYYESAINTYTQNLTKNAQ